MRHKSLFTLFFMWIISSLCLGLTFSAGRGSVRRNIRYPLSLLLLLMPGLAFAADEIPSDDWLEMLVAILPQTWESWIALVLIICAILAAVLPPPDEDAHPAWKVCHRVICWLGLGAGKMRSKGRVFSRLGKVIRR